MAEMGRPWGKRQSIASDVMGTVEKVPFLKQQLEKKIPSATARKLLATPLLPDSAKELALQYVDPKGAENMRTVLNTVNKIYDVEDTTSAFLKNTKNKILPSLTNEMRQQKTLWDTPLGGTKRRRCKKKRCKTRRRKHKRRQLS